MKSKFNDRCIEDENYIASYFVCCIHPLIKYESHYKYYLVNNFDYWRKNIHKITTLHPKLTAVFNIEIADNQISFMYDNILFIITPSKWYNDACLIYNYAKLVFEHTKEDIGDYKHFWEA